MRPVYMEVSRDKYELPVAVADSPYELAKLRRVSVYPILHGVKEKKSKYRKVWVDADE